MKKVCFAALAATVSIMLVGLSPASAHWPDAVTKWTQGPWDDWAIASQVYSGSEGSYIAADDFLCTDQSYIAEINFGGFDNFHRDDPWIEKFEVAIWSDVPEQPGFDESHPGGRLWRKTFSEADPNDLRHYKPGWTRFGDSWSINIAPEDWFHQQGTEEDPIIYWISIQGISSTGPSRFFWIFRERNMTTWGDDAAWGTYVIPDGQEQPEEWDNIGFPPTGQPYPNEWGDPQTYSGEMPDGWKSADMAFSIAGFDEPYIPEPGSMVALGAGLLALAGFVRRRPK